jgi:polyphenol oxidase
MRSVSKSYPKSGSGSGIRSAGADIESIDALFAKAGLVRSRRSGVSGPRQTRKPDQAAPEELSPPAPEPQTARNGVKWLSVPGWDFPWLWSGFSTRMGGRSRIYAAEGVPGELNLGFTAEDDRDSVAANRQLLAEAISGSAATPLIAIRQFHSNLVIRTGAADASRSLPRKADGHFTTDPGILLAVQTADCVPVLVADRRLKAVGAFHAGWRGTVRRIVETGVGRMRLELGSRSEDLVAAIGPAISQCCYAVGEEVLSEFESQFTYGRELFREVYDSDAVRTKYPMLFLTQRAPGHSPIGPSLHVDLIEANRRQLLDAGLAENAIQVIGGCTQCRPDLFFSYRGSHGRTDRMMAVIGVRG